MRTTYNKSRVGELSIAEARVLASFHGIGAELTAKVFAYEDVGGMRLELRPAPKAALRLVDVAYDGYLRFPEQDDRGRRTVEQRVDFRGIVTEVYPFTAFAAAAEPEARAVCQQFFLKFEAVAEFVRRQVVGAFAPAYRDRGTAALDARYGPASRETARLLSTLNWPLLLADVQAPAVFRDVIDYVMTHNHPRYFPLAEGNPEAIDLTGNDYGDVGDLVQTVHAQRAAAARALRQVQANARAAALLRMVCGQEHYQGVRRRGEGRLDVPAQAGRVRRLPRPARPEGPAVHPHRRPVVQPRRRDRAGLPPHPPQVRRVHGDRHRPRLRRRVFVAGVHAEGAAGGARAAGTAGAGAARGSRAAAVAGEGRALRRPTPF
jgi:hypothetical protein